MAATTAHIDDNVIPVTQTVLPADPYKPPSIKRNVQLYRYGKAGLLGKKCWKEGNIIIYDDSTFKIFKDAAGHKTSNKPIKLEDVALDLAFGKAAAKYGSPPVTGDERNFISPDNFIAVPETKERSKIHLFAAKDEHSLREIKQAIAETIAGKVRPPQLGKGPRGRYFNQNENEKWITYWDHTEQLAGEPPTEENGASHQPIHQGVHQIAAPPVVVPLPPPQHKEEYHKIEKHKHPPPPPPSTHHQPPILSTHVPTMGIPSRAEVLRLEPDYNLREESTDNVPVVRLVGGKRVREMVKRQPAQEPRPYITSIAPVAHAHYSPASIPVHRTYHMDHKNGLTEQKPTPYKIEISNYVVGEKPEITTTNIAVSTPPVKEHFTQHNEREEVVSDNQKTVINVGSSERTISKVDNSDDAVTYTTTKESSYHRSTITTSD